MTRDNRDYYDAFASSYDRGRLRGYHALVDDLQAELVIPYCAGRDVLEVGCGTGLVLARLAPHARTATGVDLSPRMLDRARRRGLDVVEADATALPLPDEAFDVVCCFKVLAHVAEIEAALAEMARVTRPGGVVLCDFYNRASLRYVVKRLTGPRPVAPGVREDAIGTRFETLTAFRRRLPSTLTVERTAGVRVLTPAAFVHRVPALGRALARLERAARDSPLGRFGGFRVVVARKAAGPGSVGV